MSIVGVGTSTRQPISYTTVQEGIDLQCPTALQGREQESPLTLCRTGKLSLRPRTILINAIRTHLDDTVDDRVWLLADMRRGAPGSPLWP